LTGYLLIARDGEIGRCKDFLFDDEKWTVRHMVADTGKWIPDRKVIISPVFLGDPDWGSHRFPVNLTKDQIENAPSLESHRPVSRQHEGELFSHYDYPYYWVGDALWGPVATPEQLREPAMRAQLERERTEAGDPHLRSINEVTGYHISAEDGEIGHVEEFILDDETWTLRYLVVDTRNWLPGRKVLLSPLWVENLDGSEGTASVAMSRDQVRASPEYDPRTPINREYEARLYDFYGRPAYW
jgi:hypothetical protein